MEGERLFCEILGRKVRKDRKIPEAAIGVVWFGKKWPEVSEWGKQ